MLDLSVFHTTAEHDTIVQWRPPFEEERYDLRKTFSSIQRAAEHNWTHPRELGGSDFTGSLPSGGLRVWGGTWGFGN